MYPVHNSQGGVVGWLKDDVLISPQGKPEAVISENAVFSYKGSYLGAMDGDFFRDKDGRAVAFLEGATKGPSLPEIKEATPPPIPANMPMRPILPHPPSPPRGAYTWSEMTWREYLRDA